MAEESPLQTSTNISPLSNNHNIPTIHPLQTLEQHSSSLINPFLLKPQKTLISPEQSPNNPRPSFVDCPLTNSDLIDGGSKELLIVDDFSEVSGISEHQFGENRETIDGFVINNGESSGILMNNNDVGCSKNGDRVISSLSSELIDETLVVGVLDDVKKSGKSGKKGNFNDVCVNDSSGVTGKKIKYSRKELEQLKFLNVEYQKRLWEEVYSGFADNVKGILCSNNVGKKRKYSRKELEKLKFVNRKSQKKFWQEVYNGFAENVRNEYDELGSFKPNKHQSGRKRNYCDQVILGDSSSENVVDDVEVRNSNEEDFGEWSEDEESDDEYQSIRRPAFMVKGEPNFESGPPEDGFEYLRRVRWEAAHIPKVKVVKPDKSKLTVQSVYMPKIPDIEKCPPHLAPLKQWEDEFISDFSELRLALSMLGDTDDSTSLDSDSVIFSRPECTKRTSKSLASLELPAGGPTVSTLLAMDPVTRVTLLNKRISLFENTSNLSKDECAWLFALCAVVATPLDADTSASLRCLLRRCAKLRAEKAEFDDEVVMLNILVSIAGKIFKQSES
ncbi:uncharacterized protein LOC141619024 [Silene latifolia]|uniref:uncharacterized protein LOC141619024 n=1 Tax=Silene latifolia TaxID=37657 RepID=UPI003D77E378